VTKHRKQHRLATSSPADLKPRIDRARREGRFQQALELAKQLHKYEPTPTHTELLKEVYLGRARQLWEQGHSRDAGTVLEVAQRLDPANPAWLELLANELARCGEVQRALTLLDQVPDAASRGQVLCQAVDAALQQEAAGRKLLPASLQPEFDQILEAVRLTETGHDEQARALLQGLSLRSPFLEWKVLLRGLQAYYQHDDARALENWQRLNPERLPARLAAPFRFQIDPAFRTAQPPATQMALQRQLHHLEGPSLVQQLRQVRAALDNPEASLTPAFRQAEAVLPALRQQGPHLVPRLANCFYWAVVETGPDDLTRYQRVFGIPADDPHFHRLRALANDRYHQLPEAHKAWQQYEKDLAAVAATWPPGHADRARALVWRHLGDNAASIPSPEKLKKVPAFLRNLADLPRPLTPSAEACYQRSLELAPDQLETHQALFHYFRDAGQAAKAGKAARRLLDRFPDHVATLEELGDLLLRNKEPAEGLALLQRALKGNPLDRDLRNKVSYAHMVSARAHVEAGRFDEARQDYRAALALYDDPDKTTLLCRWAACEFKAGDLVRAEELLRQAQALTPAPLLVSFVLVSECGRLKLPPKVKARFDREFKEGLAALPAAAAAAALIDWAAALAASQLSYRGQKTHVAKARAYLKKVPGNAFTEKQLQTVCRALMALKDFKALWQFTRLGRRRFSKEPLFPYLEAVSYFEQGPGRMPFFEVESLLETAERLARDLPPDERRERMLDDIQQRRKAVGLANPMGMGFMRDVFGRMFDPDDGYDDDDDDDDY
jgi:tetratricopeptide (TPR) repeat protein